MRRAAGWLTLLASLLVAPASLAALIPTDLTFNGEFGLDLAGGGPRASQSGTFYAREAGVDTPGAYVNGTLTGGVEPTVGVLLQHGDGVIGAGDGFGGTATASITNGSDGPNEVFADTDLGDNNQTQPLLIFNNSLTEIYRVYMSLTFDHQVAASGPDIFARSDVEVHLNGFKIFESEVLSDTFFGNTIDGVATGGFGGPVADAGQFLFEFLVGPQGLAVVELDFTLEGEDFAPLGELQGDASYFLSVDNVQLPSPGTLLLFLLSISLLSLHRRRLKTHT